MDTLAALLLYKASRSNGRKPTFLLAYVIWKPIEVELVLPSGTTNSKVNWKVVSRIQCSSLSFGFRLFL